MYRSVLFFAGCSLLLVGVLGLINTGDVGLQRVFAQQLPGPANPVVIDPAPGPITWKWAKYCSNAGGATCSFCVDHGGCSPNIYGTVCSPTSVGTAGCAAGPSRAKGTCADSLVSSCPHRDNLCGTALEPQCFSIPLQNPDGSYNCGDGKCAGVAGAGNCSGC